MTRRDEHRQQDSPEPGDGRVDGDPEPANEALPDGQFHDQDMPTADGEVVDGGDPPDEGGSAGEGGA
ncbi:hypothetical protein Q9R19_11550 [Microbacterium sp. ARD32]|uniref:hypothetical protein n=1 Tax=Microbacterium sp. ARD32 TaxID=2962577 RepID=UPI002882A68B|nr:hypothetical protein [Microbacterium sp. ARD32]MDT0158262.1 hypothetical protein [Microbacterium sp. ARD32]